MEYKAECGHNLFINSIIQEEVKKGWDPVNLSCAPEYEKSGEAYCCILFSKKKKINK